MSSYEVPGIGRIYSEKIGQRSVRVCAEIADYVKICLTMDMEPLKQEAENEIEKLFTKYEAILVEGFIKGLTYVGTLIEIEKKSRTSIIYM